MKIGKCTDVLRNYSISELKLCRNLTSTQAKNGSLGSLKSSLDSNRKNTLQVITGAPYPRVPLNVRHAELNWQGYHWKVITSVPTYKSIISMQRLDPLLNPIDTGLGVINNLCRGHYIMLYGLCLIVQYKCSSPWS